jgi:uncharacterized protein with gpF-like domain
MAISPSHKRQVAMMSAIERRFIPEMRAELRAAYGYAIAEWERTGAVPQMPQHRAEVQRIVMRYATVAVKAFGARILTAQKSGHIVLERKDFASTVAKLALQYITLEAVRRRITSIADTTRNQMIAAAARGFAEGMTLPETAGLMRDLVPGLSRYRSDLIARTETHGAANYGALGAAKETGIVLMKQWLSAEDDRTRPDHAAANGQIVGMDETFDIGGEALAYPGDPAGSASQVCNCRCVVAFIPQD